VALLWGSENSSIARAPGRRAIDFESLPKLDVTFDDRHRTVSGSGSACKE
jgi:hypothetical protein